MNIKNYLIHATASEATSAAAEKDASKRERTHIKPLVFVVVHKLITLITCHATAAAVFENYAQKFLHFAKISLACNSITHQNR